MEKEPAQFTAQNSLDLISKLLEDTRERYEESGFLITMWGFVTVVAGTSSFGLDAMGHPELAHWPWIILMIPMFIYSMYTGMQQSRSSKGKQQMKITDYAWMISGIFAMVTSFLFRVDLGSGFMLALYLPFCIAAFVTALFLKKNVFIVLTIISTILVYASMYIPGQYHSLLSAVLALLMFLIPGLILRSDYRKRQAIDG